MTRQSPHSPVFDGKKVIAAVDWLGHRFGIGDRVLYCIGAGRGQMMAIGEVIQIRSTQKFVREYQDADPDDLDAEPVRWYPGNYHRVTQRPYDDVTVQVRTLKTSGRFDNEERSKPAWVNPMNITAMVTVEKP